MILAKKDVIFYNAQYGMMEHYLNDVVVKELRSKVKVIVQVLLEHISQTISHGHRN